VSGTILLTTPECSHCGSSGEVLVATNDYRLYLAGWPVQDAFAGMSRSLREQIISGIHPECWERMFG
jgi:hypothetical protein